MIRVGFIATVSKDWMGGVNYFKNLLFAINSLEEKEIEIYVFVGKNADNDIKNMFKEHATVIEHSMFDKKTFPWFLHKVEAKIFKSNYILEKLLKKYNIKVLSHTQIINLKSCKTISWIPDFQHIHLPEMFPEIELKNRNDMFLKLIKYSDRIVLSSYDALNDLKTFAPQYINKARILQFVSQPDNKYFDLNEENRNSLNKKYQLPNEFYYLPNQFWKHKNHMLIFESIKLLIDENKEICLVCTGHLNSYKKSDDYIIKIKDYIKINKLENNIRLLGLVDYEDVFSLIKFSKAVINPSLFEGWSSSVEECKSVNKNMILSDLNVHKEQYPTATFFEKNSALSLKNVLSEYTIPDTILTESLNIRTKNFGENYKNIIMEILNK